jgi:hypothetical protein
MFQSYHLSVKLSSATQFLWAQFSHS